MAVILGNLKPEDDYTHPVGEESNFNESMYFNFFDPSQGIGGFLRLGNRPNERHAEMTTTLYLPGGRVLFMFKRPEIEHNERFDAGGCRFEVLEPSQRLRTVYEGSVVDLADPSQMEDPKQAFTQNPRKRITLDLEHDAVGPMYGGAKDSKESKLEAEQQFASAHYEQHMAVTGRLEIDGSVLDIRGYGLRDHSWGPRYWQAIQSYEWLTLNFGPDFGAMVSIVRRTADEQRRGGVVVRGDALDPIESVEVKATYAPNGLWHRTVRADVETRGGESLVFEGTVEGFIPLRNRRNDQVTHIGEGMTQWKCGDRVGYGLSEFLKTV